MHPRAKATSPTGTPGPGHSNGFLWAFKAGFLRLSKLPFASPQTLQNSPNPPNAPNPPKPAKPSKHRPQQAPQIHSNDFLWASKLPFASLQRIQTSKIPNTFPNMHPRAKATSPTGTPGPGHSNGFLRLSKLPFASPQTLQNSPNPPNPPNAPNPPKPAKPSKHRPQQAPQIHSNDFLWASKLPFASLQRIQTSKIPNTFPNMHPRAKATSPTGTPGPGHSNGFLRLSKLPFASPQTLQNSPNAPNPPKPAKPSKHRPQQAPQIHSNDFLWASKLPFASLQRIQTSKIPNTFPNMHPRAKATSPTGTPGPGHSNGFLRLSKLPFASPQTLQNSPNAPNPPKPAKPSKHRPQTTAGWTLSSSKPSKPLSLNSFPNRHPRARPQQWLSMGFQSCEEKVTKIIIFYAFSLGIYGVQFWGFSVLHCHGVFPSGDQQQQQQQKLLQQQE